MTQPDYMKVANPLLVGRSAELGRLAELIDGVSGGGGCLVVSGDPGIGKSALLAEAERLAAGGGMRVLRARGLQPEARLPFAGLHQLLQPVLGEVRRLRPAQRDALLAAFGIASVSDPSPFRVALAALELLTECAAEAAAANDGEVLAETLAAAGAALGKAVALDDLQPAISAGLVAVDDLALRFRHPLVGSALWQAASLPQRHAVLTALAAGLSGQPDRQVWFLAAAALGPDPAVADGLEAAAARAERRGALTIAIAALERAAQLTEDPNRKGERLLDANRMAVPLARMDIADRLIADARRLPLRGLVAAKAAFIDGVLSNAAWSGTSELARLVGLAAQIADEGGTRPALEALRLVALRMWWSVISQEARDLVVATAEQLGLPDDSVAMIKVLACAAPVQRGAAIRERISNLGVPAQATDEELVDLAIAATAVGAFSPAAELLDAAITRFRAVGRLGGLVEALASQALTWLLTGELVSASVAADEAARLGEEIGQPQWVASAHALGATAAALRGDLDTAVGLADQAAGFFSKIRAGTLMALVRWAQGTAALVDGRPAQAYEQLSVIFDPAAWEHHPFLRFWVVPDLAEAASRSGQAPAAAPWIAELESLADRGRDPLLLAGLSYARAVLATGDDAGPLFRAALGPEVEAWPLLHARVLLAYGAWLRRRRLVAQSRPPLRAARAAFEARGATAWANVAQQELRATGETPHRRGPAAWDRLTPQELQIAKLAAQGATNWEIGQRLYVSRRTVSTHLHRIFPKLGITSRTQLAAALASRMAQDQQPS